MARTLGILLGLILVASFKVANCIIRTKKMTKTYEFAPRYIDSSLFGELKHGKGPSSVNRYYMLSIT